MATQGATHTEEVLAAMLTENTGRHLLDSGGAYGRNFERNQAAAGSDPVGYFHSRPEAWWNYGPTLDVFHFLRQRLDYAPELDRAWRRFVGIGPMSRYFNGCETADEFLAELLKKGWAEDGSGDFAGMWVNTYNGEDYLSQVIQYLVFKLTDACPWGDEGYYVLLSIHGGCDVRGGYTDFRAFYVGDFEGVCYLLDNARAELFCQNEGCWNEYSGAHAWTFDGGGSALYDGGTGGPEPLPAEGDKWFEHLPRCPFCLGELTVYAPFAS